MLLKSSRGKVNEKQANIDRNNMQPVLTQLQIKMEWAI
jgi:hypothetical protein